MYNDSIHALPLNRTGDLFPEHKNLFYRNKLKKAGPSALAKGSVPFSAPPQPDKAMVERLNKLAARPPFSTYHKHKKNNIL